MARRIVAVTQQTPTGTADTVNLTDATYPFLLQGGNASQQNCVWEISIVGLGSAGAVTPMLLSRDSTVCATNSNGAGQTDTFLNPFTAALTAAQLTGNTNTTKPQRDTARHLANCGLNAFGGQYFWKANKQDELFWLFGNSNTAPQFGEISLSAFTGGAPGLIGAHMIYEGF